MSYSKKHSKNEFYAHASTRPEIYSFSSSFSFSLRARNSDVTRPIRIGRRRYFTIAIVMYGCASRDLIADFAITLLVLQRREFSFLSIRFVIIFTRRDNK